jgi:very-short-patch-repair endonuclease
MRQNPRRTGFARALRREMTDAERLLWHHLRDRRLLGLKFRRQVPIGPWIADFYCAEARLVVECDGGQHAASHRDAVRDADLHRRGIRTLRLWKVDVLTNPDGTLTLIADALDGATR